MVNGDTSIILSINKNSCLHDGSLAIELELEHKNRKKSINCLHYLTKNDFDELKFFLLGMQSICKRNVSLIVVEEVLELEYAISLLKEYVLDFTVADIINLYENNKRFLMPTICLKKRILRLRQIDATIEAESYAKLLKKILEYWTPALPLYVTMMDANWFNDFATYLQQKNCSLKEISGHLLLLKDLCREICKMNSAKVLCDFADCAQCEFLKTDFVCSLTKKKLYELLKLNIEDEYLVAARNLLLLKYWAAEIAFVDLLDLKMDDVHFDRIWYRRISDNKLCFVKLPSEVINTIKKKMDNGYNILFPSPFERMNTENRRIRLKMRLYKRQLRKFIELYPVTIKLTDS